MSGWKNRTFRTLSRLMRLAVMLAMQPDANFTRALAMSTFGVSTGTPIASTLTTSVRVDGQHDVEIVNHDVEDDVDVEAALGKPAQPVDLDEARRLSIGSAACDGRIESLGVADRQRGADARRQRDQLVGLGERRRHRLLDEHVHAALEKRPRDRRGASAVGTATVDRVDAAEQLARRP